MAEPTRETHKCYHLVAAEPLGEIIVAALDHKELLAKVREATTFVTPSAPFIHVWALTNRKEWNRVAVNIEHILLIGAELSWDEILGTTPPERTP